MIRVDAQIDQIPRLATTFTCGRSCSRAARIFAMSRIPHPRSPEGSRASVRVVAVPGATPMTGPIERRTRRPTPSGWCRVGSTHAVWGGFMPFGFRAHRNAGSGLGTSPSCDLGAAVCSTLPCAAGLARHRSTSGLRVFLSLTGFLNFSEAQVYSLGPCVYQIHSGIEGSIKFRSMRTMVTRHAYVSRETARQPAGVSRISAAGRLRSTRSSNPSRTAGTRSCRPLS
jgi:hypothetical protein